MKRLTDDEAQQIVRNEQPRDRPYIMAGLWKGAANEAYAEIDRLTAKIDELEREIVNQQRKIKAWTGSR